MRFIERIGEPILAALAIGLTAVLLITNRNSMPDMVQMTALGLFTLGVLAYGAFLFRETPSDEREHELSLTAGKYAYLAGAGVLTIGIVVQTLAHDLDPWLPLTLASMVIVKSIAYYTQK